MTQSQIFALAKDYFDLAFAPLKNKDVQDRLQQFYNLMHGVVAINCVSCIIKAQETIKHVLYTTQLTPM